MRVTFSIDNDFITRLEEVAEVIDKILNVIYVEIEDAKITMDVEYSMTKEADVMPNMFGKVLLDMKYDKKKTSINEFRKFEIVKRRNITNYISMRSLEEGIEYSISTNVENIVIHPSDFKLEVINSLYFYALEYTKLHYNIVNSRNQLYMQNNSKFYEKLAKL